MDYTKERVVKRFIWYPVYLPDINDIGKWRFFGTANVLQEFYDNAYTPTWYSKRWASEKEYQVRGEPEFIWLFMG